jgi:hypothetical protein
MTMLSQSEPMRHSRSSFERRVSRCNITQTTLPGFTLVLLAAACGQRYQLGEVLQPVEAVGATDPSEPGWPVIIDDVGDVDARMSLDPGADDDPAFGYRLGDVDGDGYDDYLTGYNPNDTFVDAFQVLYGGPRAANGIFPAAGDAVTTFTFNEETAPTLLIEGGFNFTMIYGYPAGDVDGDGCADILFESRRRVGGEPDRSLDGWATQRGYLWYGRPERPLGDVRLDDEGVQFEPLPALREALPDVELNGIDQFIRLAALGDLDADGFDDIAYSYYVRVPSAFDTNDNSRAVTLIYYGGPERLPARGAAALSDAQISDIELTAPLGDIDGDGSADFWMVPVLEDEYLLALGSSARLSGQISAATLGRAINVPYPSSDLRAAGDIDGDGIDDIINFDVSLSGSSVAPLRYRTHLFYGSPSWATAAVDSELADAVFHSDEGMGRLTPAGDWDGDGLTDLVFSGLVNPPDGAAIGRWTEARLIPGTVERFAGSYHLVERIDTAPRDEGQLGLPWGVYPVGDLDGDGFADVRVRMSNLDPDPDADDWSGWFIKYGAPLVSDIH